MNAVPCEHWVLAKDRFWLLWMTLPGPTQATRLVQSVVATRPEAEIRATELDVGRPRADSLGAYRPLMLIGSEDFRGRSS